MQNLFTFSNLKGVNDYMTKQMQNPYQQQQGAGGVIQQSAVLKIAINDPSLYTMLPDHCKDKVEIINAKGLADWTGDDRCFMASMIMVAIHA